MISDRKDPRSELGIDQAGVLADPAEARVLRVDALLHRPGVDVARAPRTLDRAARAQPLDKRIHAPLDDVVVVVAPGVAGDQRRRGRRNFGRIRAIDVVDACRGR